MVGPTVLEHSDLLRQARHQIGSTTKYAASFSVLLPPLSAFLHFSSWSMTSGGCIPNNTLLPLFASSADDLDTRAADWRSAGQRGHVDLYNRSISGLHQLLDQG